MLAVHDLGNPDTVERVIRESSDRSAITGRNYAGSIACLHGGLTLALTSPAGACPGGATAVSSATR
jgi:hypothetical protein